MDDGRLMIDLHNETGRRWTTAALAGAALLSAAYWTEATLLRFRQNMPEAALRAVSANGSASAAAVTPAEVLAKVLGAQQSAQAAAPGPADRFKVLGVIAGAGGRGTALVAVDGQPARSYSVGAELAPGFVLRSVSQKELTLAASPGGEILATLPLPEPGSAADSTNASAAMSPSTTAGPPLVSGSRGNPRNVEPPVNAAGGTAAPTPSPPPSQTPTPPPLSAPP